MTATLTQPRTVTLLERVTSSPGRIDKINGILRRVKILGRKSKNGYEYTDPAMRQVAALYEGIHVNQDHDRLNPRRERSMTEWVGVLRSVKVESDGVYGDLHLRQESQHYQSIMEAAERFPQSFGLSHNAEGSHPARIGSKQVVESVKRVHSVDIVTRPATTSGLFESLAPDNPGINRVATALESLRNRRGFQSPRLSQLKPGMRIDGAYGSICELLEDISNDPLMTQACTLHNKNSKAGGNDILNQIAEILERPSLSPVAIIEKLREVLRSKRNTKQQLDANTFKDAPAIESDQPTKRLPRLAKRIHVL